MKLSKIDIVNYKGFKNCNVELNSKVNVFIGTNASGKTSILTAITKSIYSITKNFAQSTEKNKELNLTKDDVNYASNFCFVDSTIVGFPGYEFDLDAMVYANRMREVLPSQYKAKRAGLEEFVRWFQTKLSTFPCTIPIFKFYPADRGGLTFIESRQTREYLTSQLEAWSNIYQDRASYSRFFTWFFENETDELRLQRDSHDFTIQSPVLRDIRQALKEAFKYLGYGDNISVKSAQTKGERNSKLTPGLVLENVVTNEREIIDNKSAGEKAIVTLVADIAYNLSLAKDYSSNNDFLQSPGIVMIDEIETHLHPTWQRQIVPLLISVFPNIQFFVATHSPQVVGSVKSDSVFICDNFNISRVQLRTKGEDTNSLLKYIFGATDRPKEYVEILNTFYEAIDRNATYPEIQRLIERVGIMEDEDGSSGISDLTDEMRIVFEAHKFDRDHAKNQ